MQGASSSINYTLDVILPEVLLRVIMDVFHVTRHEVGSYYAACIIIVIIIITL